MFQTHNATETMGLDDDDYGGHRVPKCNHVGTGASNTACSEVTLVIVEWLQS